jgi:hypothetical protein
LEKIDEESGTKKKNKENVNTGEENSEVNSEQKSTGNVIIERFSLT